jgi:hypothetical protein
MVCNTQNYWGFALFSKKERSNSVKSINSLIKYKIKIHFINHHAIKTYREVEVEIDAALISALDGGKRSVSFARPF